jgi:hypothetical protein
VDQTQSTRAIIVTMRAHGFISIALLVGCGRLSFETSARDGDEGELPVADGQAAAATDATDAIDAGPCATALQPFAFTSPIYWPTMGALSIDSNQVTLTTDGTCTDPSATWSATCMGACTDLARNGAWSGSTTAAGFRAGDTIAMRVTSDGVNARADGTLVIGDVGTRLVTYQSLGIQQVDPNCASMPPVDLTVYAWANGDSTWTRHWRTYDHLPEALDFPWTADSVNYSGVTQVYSATTSCWFMIVPAVNVNKTYDGWYTVDGGPQVPFTNLQCGSVSYLRFR